MCEIISFDDFKKKKEPEPKEEDTTSVIMPTKADVDLLNAVCASFPKDQMVPDIFWNGDCWKTLFDGIVKEVADNIGADQWDVLAVLICKLRGVWEEKS